MHVSRPANSGADLLDERVRPYEVAAGDRLRVRKVMLQSIGAGIIEALPDSRARAGVIGSDAALHESQDRVGNACPLRMQLRSDQARRVGPATRPIQPVQ